MNKIDLIKTDEVRVSRICLKAAEISPAHYHSNVIESIVCLSGEIEVVLDSSSDPNILKPGNLIDIQPLDGHHLINRLNSASEYLLVQKGSYDFVPIKSY
ncbi:MULTISPECIES: cupin domain-containing protein [Thalassolituus]|uniref:cupin domain-containing protein n=1 Tax=Thalassolituus TaxID=187492 RepID=UPI000970AA68|nr:MULTISPECIES: cupin domain-containing protein [Thalassolituus]TPD55439.1 MAG: cupin domain-containing protein [Thalassolituus maritimus]